MKNQIIQKIIDNYFSGSYNDLVKSKFFEWFITDDFLSEKETAMADIWEQVPSLSTEQTVTELRKVKEKIRYSEQIEKRKRILSICRRIAAIIILPIAAIMATSYYFTYYSNIPETEWIQCYVPYGETTYMTLPDGSEVWLNSGSLLLYTNHFTNDKRSVYLSGEGHFQVKADPSRPFLVKTNLIEVEALGTNFNVEAYPETGMTISTLESGRIRVYDPVSEKNFFPLPDQQIIYDHISGVSELKSVNAQRILQWKHGYMTFNKVSLEYILKTLERRFDITIHFESSKSEDRLFTVKFNPDEGLERVLEILKEVVSGLKYKINENVVIIY